MKPKPIDRMIAVLEELVARWEPAAMDHWVGRPFHVLIGCLISLRTLDEVTVPACRRLFQLADNPWSLAALPTERITQAIQPAMYARTKAATLKRVSHQLIARYKGRVPDTIEELDELPGVGRKTANLVVTKGYDKPGICVDTHVHRVTNRWGYVSTSQPDETEMALRLKLPTRHWKRINGLLVPFGKHMCRPAAPLCSQCPLLPYCDQVGVPHWR